MENKLIERIQKLLALTESSNENESKLAMLKVQELLVKNKLSLKDVESYKKVNISIKEHISDISFRQGKWKAQLGQLIAENFGCYQYFRGVRSKYIVFFGKEEDVIVCNIVLEYAIDCIQSAVKKLRYQYSRRGLSTKGLENDYALGFIVGLKQSFDKQKEQNKGWGLVLVKDVQVVEAYENIEFSSGINTSAKFTGHEEVLRKGKQDGEEFSISDKIARKEEETQLI